MVTFVLFSFSFFLLLFVALRPEGFQFFRLPNLMQARVVFLRLLAVRCVKLCIYKVVCRCHFSNTLSRHVCT